MWLLTASYSTIIVNDFFVNFFVLLGVGRDAKRTIEPGLGRTSGDLAMATNIARDNKNGNGNKNLH